MKIAVCIPCHGSPKFKFTVSLGGLLLNTVYEGMPTPPTIELLALESSNLPMARNQLADMALKREPDYVLWLDADHSFPPDSLLRLLAHDLDVVGINQPRRNPPYAPTATSLDGKQVHTTAEKVATGLVEPVRYSGLGMALIKAGAMRKVGFPMFAGGEEDIWFADRLAKAGFAWHVDHALSMEVGHIAETELRFSQS